MEDLIQSELLVEDAYVWNLPSEKISQSRMP